MSVKISLLILFFVSCFLGLPTQAALFSSEKTIDKVRQKIAEQPTEGRSRTKAVLYSNLGTLLYKNSDFADAAEAFETALQYRTNKSMRRHIYRFLGKSYESSGRLDKCIAAYEQAVHYDKRNWRRHRDLATIYEQVQFYHKAIESYNNALKRNPKEGSIYFVMGRTQRKMGLYKRAEESLLKAKAFNYDKADFFRELSYVYEGKSQFQKALLTFEKVVSDGSNSADWARYIYLAVLSQNKTFANQGMDNLRKRDVDEETLAFYESLVQLTGHSFLEIYQYLDTDPAVRSLFNTVGHENYH